MVRCAMVSNPFLTNLYFARQHGTHGEKPTCALSTLQSLRPLQMQVTRTSGGSYGNAEESEERGVSPFWPSSLGFNNCLPSPLVHVQ